MKMRNIRDIFVMSTSWLMVGHTTVVTVDSFTPKPTSVYTYTSPPVKRTAGQIKITPRKGRDDASPTFLTKTLGGTSGGAIHPSSRARVRAGALAVSNDSVEEGSSKPTLSSSYYLLSTVSTWKSIMINTAILYILRLAMLSFLPQQLKCHATLQAHVVGNNSIEAHKTMMKIGHYILPLLSSSCCAIQLLFNAVAGVGCVGFNTVLGPLRKYFVSILLFTSITSFSRQNVAPIIFSWCIAMMPEMVHWINQRRAMMGRGRGHGEAGQNLPIQATIKLTIPGMGCVACISKIDTSLRSSSSSSSSSRDVVESSSWLNGDGVKGGKAKIVVRVSNQDEVDNAVQDAIGKIRDAGFKCEVESLSSQQIA